MSDTHQPESTIGKQKYSTAILSIVISCMISQVVLAQPNQPEEVLKNASIIELKELGLGENLIVEKIKSSHCEFDVTLKGLKQLKGANVSDAVIAAMLTANAPAKVNGEIVAAQTADLDNPKAPHEAGIWIYQEDSGKAKMTQLEPSVYSQKKTGAALFMQFGQTVKHDAVVASAHAGIVTSNRQPIFYFYFEHTQSGLSDSRLGATSANEYILAQFEVVEKDNQRRLVMGSINAYAGGASGAEGKSIRSLSVNKLSPGIYKVTPKEPLGSGEYGFYYGGNTGNGKVFDFGVKGSSETEPKSEIVEDKSQDQKKHPFKDFFHKKTDTATNNATAQDAPKN